MKLHWVHMDCLRMDWVKGPAVYVFDDLQLADEGWGLKRIGFVYECLLEMPEVEIWRGPVAETLAALGRERGLDGVVTVRTPDPWLLGQAARIGVEWLEPEPFVSLTGPVDLRRFSRYWAKAERVLFKQP